MFKFLYSVKLVFLGLYILCIISSCKKNTDPPPQPTPPPMGMVSFHIHSNIDTAEVMAMSGMAGGMPVRDSTGRRIQLDIAQFYISGITLKNAGGSYKMSNVYILKTIGQEDLIIGNVPEATYTSVSFNIGIDPAANATVPASYPAGHALAAQSPSMWFNTAAQGYIFMNIQGLVDTTAKNNGPINVPISFQLGTNAQLQTVNLPAKPLTVISGGNARIHLIADYAKLLKVLNFKTQRVASPWSNAALAGQMAANIPAMFKYE